LSSKNFSCSYESSSRSSKSRKRSKKEKIILFQSIPKASVYTGAFFCFIVSKLYITFTA